VFIVRASVIFDEQGEPFTYTNQSICTSVAHICLLWWFALLAIAC